MAEMCRIIEGLITPTTTIITMGTGNMNITTYILIVKVMTMIIATITPIRKHLLRAFEVAKKSSTMPRPKRTYSTKTKEMRDLPAVSITGTKTNATMMISTIIPPTIPCSQTSTNMTQSRESYLPRLLLRRRRRPHRHRHREPVEAATPKNPDRNPQTTTTSRCRLLLLLLEPNRIPQRKTESDDDDVAPPSPPSPPPPPPSRNPRRRRHHHPRGRPTRLHPLDVTPPTTPPRYRYPLPIPPSRLPLSPRPLVEADPRVPASTVLRRLPSSSSMASRSMRMDRPAVPWRQLSGRTVERPMVVMTTIVMMTTRMTRMMVIMMFAVWKKMMKPLLLVAGTATAVVRPTTMMSWARSMLESSNRITRTRTRTMTERIFRITHDALCGIPAILPK
mmetsp:Transcript_19436/g.39767  ORF Transcript_19436/g.39767 Transcript_19436/m.39767 type:complete len:391 (+) Transcript_19436:538-1710(+)